MPELVARQRILAETFDAAGVEYTIVNAEGGASTMQTQTEQAITNGARVLLIVNLDSGSGAAIIAQARMATAGYHGYLQLQQSRTSLCRFGSDHHAAAG